jgi:putative RNA 2'-phosphotransferase
MLSEKEITRLSKFLSLVLRHQPGKIGITLDANGWTNVALLLSQSNKNGVNLTEAILEQVVQTNTKKRFSFNEDKNKIRANQGHSVEVDLGYLPQEPPTILYHGTAENFLDSILKTGLNKRKRHHVHLSADFETARQVGKRHGKPVVFTVEAAAMNQDGYAFYLSSNKVWLTEQVPAKYLKLLP